MVGGFIPAPSCDVRVVLVCIPTPLLGVSRHIIRSERAHTLEAAGSLNATPSEIAEWNDVRAIHSFGGGNPVVPGRQPLDCEFRISGGLAPPTSLHRLNVFPHP